MNHFAVALLALAVPAFAATYHVDSVAGDDANSGLSPDAAWKTLAPANAREFTPGDALLLRAGGTYAGPLELHGSGLPCAPITVGRYGDGPLPHITVGPGGPPVVSLYNGEYWEVADLEISNGVIGVFAYVKDFGVAHHLYFRGLQIHDIPGGTTGDNGGFLVKREGELTWFDDLLIEGCTIERADRNGILLTDYPTAKDTRHSKRVVIRGNRLRDIGGDGIFILGCDGAIIEENVLRYAHQRVGREPGERACAGIWPHRCNDTLIQRNEVSHTAVGGKTVWDSEAFDDDVSCRGTIFQYNYSHENAGGFLLVCGGSRGTIVRHNISQNDATATFTFEGDDVGDLSIHNNTVYVGEGMNVSFARNTFGAPNGVRFANNLLYAAGTLTYDFNKVTDISFASNAFLGNHVKRPDDPGAVLADPLLAKPGSGEEGFGSLGGYRLQPGSPCRNAGEPILSGGQDLFGKALSPDRAPAIGASAD